MEDYTHIFTSLFTFSSSLQWQTESIANTFCREVEVATQGRAQLILHHQRLPNNDQAQLSSPSMLMNAILVHSHSRVYGMLYIVLDPTQLSLPSLPLPIAHLLAHICGLLLYSLEISMLLQLPFKQFEPQVHKPLTKSEQKILALMCRGNDQETIARTLHIAQTTVATHRQHIYDKLGAHNERDVYIAAYLADLFSPLKEPMFGNTTSMSATKQKKKD